MLNMCLIKGKKEHGNFILKRRNSTVEEPQTSKLRISLSCICMYETFNNLTFNNLVAFF